MKVLVDLSASRISSAIKEITETKSILPLDKNDFAEVSGCNTVMVTVEGENSITDLITCLSEKIKEQVPQEKSISFLSLFFIIHEENISFLSESDNLYNTVGIDDSASIKWGLSHSEDVDNRKIIAIMKFT